MKVVTVCFIMLYASKQIVAILALSFPLRHLAGAHKRHAEHRNISRAYKNVVKIIIGIHGFFYALDFMRELL